MLKTSLKASTAIALIFAAQLALTRAAYSGGLEPVWMEPEVIAPARLSFPGTPYVGVQIGCSWLDEDDGIQSENGPCDAVGGLYLGVNFAPRGNFVWGGEADFNFSDNTFSGVSTGGYSVATDWEASLRLRLGYMINEKSMVYTAGGLAFAGAEMEGAGSNTHTGWTLGLGYERTLSEQWLGRIELRHNEYGSETYVTPTGPFDVEFGNTQALIGLSYKF